MKKETKNNDISFLGKTVVLFRRIKNKISGWHLFDRFFSKQKKLAGYEGRNSSNEAKVAYGFGLARIISIVFLCIVLAVTMLTGSGIISYENVYYMFKDISYITSFNESIPNVLSYSKPVSNQDFASFKNGLAVAGDNEIKFFTSKGRTTITVGSDFVNPKITCSDTSALVFDQGRRGFAVYNSFIKVKSDSTEFPISSADMCPDGSFCLVTGAKNYSSAVRFYDSDLELKWEFLKNDYIISANISDNGKYVAVLSLDSNAGESKVNLNLVSVAKGEIISSVSINGVMPYGAYFIANDRVVLICDEIACVYSAKGNLIAKYEYHEDLTGLAVTGGGFALLFDDTSVNLGNMLLVFDDNAKLEYSSKLVGNVRDVEMNGKNVFLLFDNKVLKIDARFGSERSVDFYEENSRLLVFDNGNVMICTPVTAYYIQF